MATKAPKTRKAAAGDPNDPDGMYVWSRRYLEALRVRGYSERTVHNRGYDLGVFTEWCAARSITRPTEVTKPIIERYQRHLYHYRKPNSGKPLSFAAQICRLIAIRGLFKWLARQNVLLRNPASEIELPRAEKRLPRFVLTADEAERVLMQPDVRDPIGVRDRAILETLYSTGIRRIEVIHLTVFDLDAARGTLMVRLGKGKKDRMVPIGERAVAWITKYLSEVRPTLAVEPDEGALFLTNLGESFTPNRLSQLVRTYVDAANIGKRGSCHLFRHTMATLMLEGGADIRFIQAMLGHARLDTTQIYTQVSIRKLKEIHTATHPARMRPAARSESASDAEAAAPEETASAEAELLSALSAEAVEDGEEIAPDAARPGELI
jgi:integrase/recombinase XerD